MYKAVKDGNNKAGQYLVLMFDISDVDCAEYLDEPFTSRSRYFERENPTENLAHCIQGTHFLHFSHCESFSEPFLEMCAKAAAAVQDVRSVLQKDERDDFPIIRYDGVLDSLNPVELVSYTHC